MALSRNSSVVLAVVSLVVGMFLLSFAAVPLYRIFCSVTGFGGTTREAEAAPETPGQRTITVQFNADIDPNLDWNFKPEQRAIKIRTGEQKLAFFSAENLSNHDIKGMATYNVTPDNAGVYFNKIACFCFDEQTLKAGQKVSMPVSFFIDPAIEKDPYLKDVKTITLSYTFFKVKKS